MGIKKRGGVKFLLFCFLLALDQLTKFFTFRHIPLMSWAEPHYPYGGIGVFRNWKGISFSLNHVENLGAAWGLFAAYSEWLFVIRCVVIVGLLIYLLSSPHGEIKTWALLFLFTGALGNVCDFFIYGHVIDMFHFNFWGYTFPIFNVADSLITLGISGLFLLSFWEKKKNLKQAA